MAGLAAAGAPGLSASAFVGDGDFLAFAWEGALVAVAAFVFGSSSCGAHAVGMDVAELAEAAEDKRGAPVAAALVAAALCFDGLPRFTGMKGMEAEEEEDARDKASAASDGGLDDARAAAGKVSVFAGDLLLLLATVSPPMAAMRSSSTAAEV